MSYLCALRIYHHNGMAFSFSIHEQIPILVELCNGTMCHRSRKRTVLFCYVFIIFSVVLFFIFFRVGPNVLLFVLRR